MRGVLRWMSVGCVGYSCISGSLSYALGLVGTSRAKTSGVDLHSEVIYFVLCGTVDEVHLLYYGDVRWVCCGVEWSEPEIWQS